MSCYCGHAEPYEDCCQPYHAGTAHAPTPEALMRSRYSAYAVQAIDYLRDTHHPKKQEEFDPVSAKSWAKESTWLGLEIVLAEQAGDDEGYVEFKARYTRDGTTITHHERSRFVKIDGRWYYDDGRMLAEPVKRAGPKVGRNDPCPCGSGKKYKKCCGR